MAGAGMTRHELSMTIVRAIAETAGEPPSELEFALQDHIDTDALDALATSPGDDWSLQFTVEGTEVRADGDGSVIVDGTEYRWATDGAPKTAEKTADP